MTEELLSQWHNPITDQPVRDGNYDIKFHDGHIQRWPFENCGWKDLPTVYVAGWRGIARPE